MYKNIIKFFLNKIGYKLIPNNPNIKTIDTKEFKNFNTNSLNYKIYQIEVYQISFHIILR